MINPLLLDIAEEFESERLLLRTPRPGDGPTVNESVRASLNELKPWMPWAQQEPTLEESEEVARRAYLKYLAREDMALLLFLKSTGQHIGGSGLHRIDWSVPRFEIGYWLHTAFCGRGYMTEAVQAVARFAFDHLGARRVEIRMDDNNERSWRVAERAGFTLEGILRHDARSVDDALRDTRVYSKIAFDTND